MKRILTLAALCGISALAISADAATPNPCTSYAGMADADKDGFCAFVGASTAASTGYSGAIDCDDTHANMNPGLTEVVGDGIDQDCSGSDSVFPVSDPTVARYRANFGSWNANTFITEYDRCKAATGRCSVDSVAGKFVIKDTEKDAFLDIYQGTSKILRADGVREVVTLEEASHFRPGGTVAVGSGGIGTKTAIRIADERAAAAVRPLREEMLAADVLLDGRVDALESVDEAITGVVNDHGSAIESLESGLAAEHDDLVDEARMRLAEDERIERKADVAWSVADYALDTANIAQSHGPLLEAYALGGMVIGTSVNDDGDVARNSFGGGAGGGLNFGLDGSGYRVNGFADIVVGADGGSGPAHSEAIGAEATFAPGGSDFHLGPFAAYSQRSTQVNALESQVVGRNPLLGLSVAAPFAPKGAAHGLFQARVGCGPEFIGMAGDSVTSGVGLGCRATVGIGGGVGALQ